MTSRIAAVACVLWLLTAVAQGAGFLAFLEAQAVMGYSSLADDLIFYSAMQRMPMQKPSLGLDYLQRLSGSTGDYGAIAVQARVAYTEEEGRGEAEFQLYNAYFKLKTRPADWWIGHNRPAMGLDSYFDNHALLLESPGMRGFGFERDWGVGAIRYAPWGEINFSVTTGSGMPLRAEGNYLAALRVSKGLLNQDNYTWGWSAAYGETLDTVGNHIINDDPEEYAMLGTDLALLRNNLESRLDLTAGKQGDDDAAAAFWRFGVNFLSEGRLKLELQPSYRLRGDEDAYQLALGTSYQISGDVAVRLAYVYDAGMELDRRAVMQWYFYRKL